MVAERTTRLEDAVRATGDLKLIAYIMAGHPSKKRSIDVGKRLAASGIAALEIGIPHSDPLADGPVIQRAGHEALRAGMTVAAAIEVAAAVAADGIPVVLMSYINPILQHDARKFAAEAAQAGVAGVIVPDLPIEEAEPVTAWFRAASLDTIFMVAPTTPPERIASI
ncbi:MAG TPA: tryptophan synthase subunit alpha, partial [Candidatus Limnocylindria bacterium]|nr:tryptophan synthase subunit alpha [Candidatus Limnocylindria bacterium]